MKLSDLSNYTVVKAPTITPGYNNNPFNIKAGSETQQYISNGTASMGTAATDGGNFLKFNSRNDAIAAAQDLLFKSGIYKGLSVDSALKKWSNNAYGGDIVPDLATSTIDSLTPDQQTELLNAMELKGENDAVPAGVKTLQNIGSYKVVTPNQKTNTPNRFLPQSPLDGTPIATMAANAKAGKNPVVDFVTGPEQQFGKAMAGAITGQSQVADAQKVTADEQNYIKTLVDERAKIQASGGDTSRLDGMIANAQKSTSATYQQPDIPTTASTVEGALGTAADIATMGTYGAASKGAKFGELMAEKTLPTVVSAGEKVLGKDAGSITEKVIEDISPKMTAKETADATKKLGTTKTGIFGKIKLNVDPYLKNVGAAIEKYVPDFSKLGSFSEKVNATKTAVYSMADDLKKQIIASGKDIIFPFKELASKMDAVEKPIAIKADATLEKQFDLAKEAAMKIVQKNGGTVSSLLDSRKEFDQLVEKQFPTLYDKANAPMRDAITSMRNVMNDFIADNLPDVAYKNSLKIQSQLFSAIDNLSEKAAGEINTNVIQRAASAIKNHPVASGLGGAALYAEAKKIPVVGGLLP